MTVRVRFAPSPTGYLHVGGARTALFNWLFARKMEGIFVLRIEDTDVERSSDDMVGGILEAMKWMGLDWDEGPYHQSERVAGYRDRAMQLIRQEQAYYCFCSPSSLAAKRARDPSLKVEWKYDRTCLSLEEAEICRRLERGEPAAVRFKVPGEPVRFDDAVFGPIERGHEEIEDFILLRSDGHPTYHLSVVADDIDMKITHVVRGDHISNTPKQLLLYDAFGVSKFVHVPLILIRADSASGTARRRYSHTAIRASFPRPLVIFSSCWAGHQGTIRRFSTGKNSSERSRSGASPRRMRSSMPISCPGSTANISTRYLVGRLRPAMEDLGLWEDRFAGTDADWFSAMIGLIRPRFRLLKDLAAEAATYTGERVEYEPPAVDRFMKDAKLAEYLPTLAGRLQALERFLESTEGPCAPSPVSSASKQAC